MATPIDSAKRNTHRRVTRLRKKESLVWTVQASNASRVSRKDLDLGLMVQWSERDQAYGALAIEAAPEDSTEEVLANHAHHNLGLFVSEFEAKKACFKYALTWMEADIPIDPCACEDIDGSYSGTRREFNFESNTSYMDLELRTDGSLKMHVGGEYGGTLSSQEALRLADSIQAVYRPKVAKD